ncbi:MAG: HD family hydrolase [Candidatus Poribacteria bacterium]|nr:HD family hydrolase [Candidatus Poribacteria bacterium]
MSGDNATHAPSASAALDLLHALETLKNLPRTGWRLRGIRDGESLADHCFRTTFTAMLLADSLVKRGATLDTERVIRMATLHEIAETRIGDIPFPALKHIPEDVKDAAEADAAKTLLSPLGELGDDYLALWNEYEARQTPEAKVVRIADKLEMLLQAWEYESAGARGLDDFWRNSWNFTDFDAFPFVNDLMTDLRKRLDATRTGDN